MNELNAALMTRLAGGTALVSALGGTFIFANQAPDDQDYPFVLFNEQSNVDTNLTPHTALNILLFVRAYDDRSGYYAGALNDLIMPLLHKNPLSVSGYGNYSLKREDRLEAMEVLSNNVKVWMSGAVYRVRLDKTS